MIPQHQRPAARNPVSQRNRGSATYRPERGAHTTFVRAVIFALLIALSGASFALESEPDEPLSVDEQSATPGEAVEPAPTPPQEQAAEALTDLAGRIVTAMRDAEARLVDRRLDTETGELQERINADLARLLAALEQEATQPSPVPGEDSRQQMTGGDSPATGGTGNQGSPGPSTEGESTAGDRPGTLTDTELEHRRNLATSVWGHLPQKERDEMLGAFSERFLPAYDELVRQYYEALATRKSQER